MGYNIVRYTTIRLVIANNNCMVHVIVSMCKNNLFNYIYLIKIIMHIISKQNYYAYHFKTKLLCISFVSAILIRLYLEKLIYFYIKNNNYSNSFALRLVIARENFLKTCDNGGVLVYILIAF